MSAAAPPMLQQQGEFDQLLALYRDEQPRRVLEIGVHLGGTLYQWLRHAAGGSTVVAVDDQHRAREQYGSWTPDGVELVVITGDSASAEVIEQVAEHGLFDWVFIDADHHELHVRADWMNYGQRLAAPGAIVALHDILPSDDPTIQVEYLWREIQRDYVTRTIALAGGLGIGVVYRDAREPPPTGRETNGSIARARGEREGTGGSGRRASSRVFKPGGEA